MKKDTNSTVTISGLFNTLLQIAFIVLKLCGVIKWSWWWVLAPSWIPLVIVILILVPIFLLVRRH